MTSPFASLTSVGASTTVDRARMVGSCMDSISAGSVFAVGVCFLVAVGYCAAQIPVSTSTIVMAESDRIMSLDASYRLWAVLNHSSRMRQTSHHMLARFLLFATVVIIIPSGMAAQQYPHETR